MTADAGTAREHEELRGRGIGRREDPALLTGWAEFTDDRRRRRMLHAAIARSQHGHALIESVDTAEAEAVDGVVAVLDAGDVEPERRPLALPDPFPPPEYARPMTCLEGPAVPRRPLLADGRVRYTGEPVAVVLAEDRYAAHEGASKVAVEYDRLDAVVDAEDALEDGAPRLHEEATGNLAFVWEIGDEDGVEDAFEAADRSVTIDLTNQRLAPNPIETRGALADYDRASGQLEVELSTQAPHAERTTLSEVLGIPENRVRVIGAATGGGFGSKGKRYVGPVLAAWASMRVGRPVKWVATRTEAMRTDRHGRAHRTTCRLAFDDDGTVRGLRADTTVDLGAYLSQVAAHISTAAYGRMLSGQYAVPAVYARVSAAYTNTAPVDAYRGAGRPEACYVVERLMSRAARELGMDPAEFRRKNMIPPEDFPYETPVAAVYDSGDYEPALDRALELIGYDDLRARQEALREDGRYLGVGIGCLVESSGTGAGESGLVRFDPSGTVTAYVGTFDHGQGHRTSFAQVVADELGVPYEDIEIVEGDTAQVPQGAGTMGSRSAIMGGNALVETAGKVVEQARDVAAHHLEAGPQDVEFDAGEFHVAGAPDRSIHIQEVARRTYRGEVPEGAERGLEATSYIDPITTNPFGAHAAVVEVDLETGAVDLKRYVAVDDCGNLLNPTIVEGQVHGGIAQGLGQALHEGVVYDGNGQLVNGSFQDYTMPRAQHVPELVTDHTVTPSPLNELGVKGIGEAGTIAAPPAVVNAVLDALSPVGVEGIDMPLTDETVWRAIRAAGDT